MKIIINGSVLEIVVRGSVGQNDVLYQWSVVLSGVLKRSPDLSEPAMWSGCLYASAPAAQTAAADVLTKTLSRHPECLKGVNKLPILPSVMDPNWAMR